MCSPKLLSPCSKSDSKPANLHLDNTMDKKYKKSIQASRHGKSAITIYVRPECKEAIRHCLMKNGYGWSFQEGIANLLQTLLKENGFNETNV